MQLLARYSPMELILASQSIYRAQLLAKLRVNFTQMPSFAEESVLSAESPEERAQRLSKVKAESVVNTLLHSNDRTEGSKNELQQKLVIGSDQVAALGTTLLRKPGSPEVAAKQLAMCSGKTANFYTGCCVINTATSVYFSSLDKVEVTFRNLSNTEITAYLEAEQPYDCAGSFKAEGLGISLFESIQGHDPNALIGLPLISLCRLLRKHNFEPLEHIT